MLESILGYQYRQREPAAEKSYRKLRKEFSYLILNVIL